MIKLITATALAATLATAMFGQEVRHKERTTTTTKVEGRHRGGFHYEGRVRIGERHDRDDFRFKRFHRHGTFNGFEVYIIDGEDYYLATDGCWYPVMGIGPVYCD